MAWEGAARASADPKEIEKLLKAFEEKQAAARPSSSRTSSTS